MLQFFLFHFNSDPQLLLSLVLCGRGSHLETASLSLSLVNMCSKYYTEYSAICHPVYGEVFGYLLGEFITIVILHNILLMLTKVYMYIQFVQGTKALQFLVNECYWPRACLLFFSFKSPSFHTHTHTHTHTHAHYRWSVFNPGQPAQDCRHGNKQPHSCRDRQTTQQVSNRWHNVYCS